MTDAGPAGGFAPTASFEVGRVTAMAADEERVALGTRRGTVEVVAADDRTTVEFDAAVEDLAVGDRVFALVDGAITALSDAGTRVWSVELPGARELAALPEAGVVGAVTDDHELVGFDAVTGGEEFHVERPHADVTDDPGFVGADGAFVLSAWSFLAVRNLDGTERFDRNLDGAIESIGVVGETVVASLKDERVVGVDAVTGDRQWERELAVTDLPDRGVDALLFPAEGQLVSLAPDGTYTTVADLPSGDVYPSSDGHLFCAVSDDTVAVYCSTGDPAEALDVAVEGDLVPGETDAVELTVENAGERPVAGTLSAGGEGVTLRDVEWDLDLAPGETASRSVGVASVSADDTAAVAVAADGDHLASASLSVTDGAGALEVAAELDGVRDGVATLSVAVENAGDAPATDVSVSPGGAALDRLPAGESATATVETPFDPGAAIPVRVEAAAAEADAEVVLPDSAGEVTVAVTDDGFVDVTVANPADAGLTDALEVAGDPFAETVERRVDLPANARFVLALRPDRSVDEGVVEARLAGLGVEESLSVAGLDAPAGRDGHGRGAGPGVPASADAGTDAPPGDGRADTPTGQGRTGEPSADERADPPPGADREPSRRDDPRPRRETGRDADFRRDEADHRRGDAGDRRGDAEARRDDAGRRRRDDRPPRRDDAGRGREGGGDRPRDDRGGGRRPRDARAPADGDPRDADRRGRRDGDRRPGDRGRPDRDAPARDPPPRDDDRQSRRDDARGDDRGGSADRRDGDPTGATDGSPATGSAGEAASGTAGSSTDRTASGGVSGGAAGGGGTGDADSDGRETADAGDPDAGSAGTAGSGAGASGTGGLETGPRLSAERTLEDAEPDRTQGVRETVTVTNDGDGPAEDVTVSFEDSTAEVGDLAPGESATVERHHAFADTGAAEIPAGTVTAADADEVALDSRTVSVSPAEFAADVEVAIDDGYRIRAELTNDRDVDCSVGRIGVRKFGRWEADVDVPAGETVEWTRSVDAPDEPLPAVEAAVEYAFADRDDRVQWGTLAPVPDPAAADPEGTEALSVGVGDETRVSGGYGSVVLVVENAGTSPVEDVSVAAEGDAVSDLMYAGGESVDRLAPGETFTHFVDVETEGHATVPLTMSVGDDEEAVELAGPAPATEDDWSPETLAEWQVAREGEADGSRSHVATAFETA